MLFASPTEYGTGIQLMGDTPTLRRAHTILHTLTTDETGSDAMTTYVLALAYDIRKASEGQRDYTQPVDDFDNTLHVYTVNVDWINFLCQIKLLRQNAALTPTTRKQQALLYSLEALASDALIEHDEVSGRAAVDWLFSSGDLPPGFLTSFIDQCFAAFIEYPDGERFQQLPRLLSTISPLSEAYQRFREKVERAAADYGCRPDEIAVGPEEVPDFKW